MKHTQQKNLTKNANLVRMLSWIPQYIEIFGPFTEEQANHWTMIKFLRSELGLSLNDINNLRA